jgi:hypothetical protein
METLYKPPLPLSNGPDTKRLIALNRYLAETSSNIRIASTNVIRNIRQYTVYYFLLGSVVL